MEHQRAALGIGDEAPVAVAAGREGGDEDEDDWFEAALREETAQAARETVEETLSEAAEVDADAARQRVRESWSTADVELQRRHELAYLFISHDLRVVRALSNYVIVMKDGDLHGIISERDYARQIILKGRSSRDTKVEEIMTSEVVCVTPDRTVEEGLREQVFKEQYRDLPDYLHGFAYTCAVLSDEGESESDFSARSAPW